VRFFVKAAVTAVPVETRSNLWGAVGVSTPEATLLDLLRYNGGIERTALIVGDLAKKCRPAGLRKALDAAHDPPSAQRLGYLFETLGDNDLAKTIEKWLSPRHLPKVDLAPGGGPAWAEQPKWRLRINSRIEAVA